MRNASGMRLVLVLAVGLAACVGTIGADEPDGGGAGGAGGGGGLDAGAGGGGSATGGGGGATGGGGGAADAGTGGGGGATGGGGGAADAGTGGGGGATGGGGGAADAGTGGGGGATGGGGGAADAGTGGGGGATGGGGGAADAGTGGGGGATGGGTGGGSADAGQPTSYVPTHFVTATATGSGDGSASNPWTLMQAMQNAVAGNVVQVGPGVYSGASTGSGTTPVFQPTNGGTATQPLVFFAQYPAANEPNPANRSKIRRTGAVNCPVMGIGYGGQRSYVIFDGFWFDYADGAAPWPRGIFYLAADNTNVSVRRFRFDRVNLGTADDGDNYNCIQLHGPTRTTITDSRFVNGYDPTGSHNESCITTYGASDFRIVNNTFDGVTTGVYVKGSNAGVGNWGLVARNVFRGCKRGMELTENQDGFTVDVSQNLLYDWGATGAAHGISFENSVAPQHRNFRVFQNTVVAPPTAGSGAVVLENSINMTGNVFRDNLVVGETGNMQVLVNGWEVPSLTPFAAWDYNWYFNAGAVPTFALSGAVQSGLAAWQTASGRDANARVGDPMFVNAAAHDYRLAPGSPARTASSTGGPVGAYVTGAEELGVRPAPAY